MNLTPSQTASALKILVHARRPAFIWGPPGIGKSDIVRQVCKDMGLEIRDVRATLLDPVDLRGLPRVQDGRTHWSPPDFLPQSGSGVLFLDELNAAPQSVQVAGYQLILDRRLGEYELPEGWLVIAAGNRLADGAAAVRMPSPLANRFMHLEMTADLDSWISWAFKHGIQPELMGFLKFRPSLLHQHSRDSHAFPTPRSWFFCSQLLKSAGQVGRDIELALIEGTVGEGAASEFYAFMKLWRDVPQVEEILKNPSKAPIPEDPACKHAVAFAIAGHMSKANAAQCMTYLKRMTIEYTLCAVKECSQRSTEIEQAPEVTAWIMKHRELFQ